MARRCDMASLIKSQGVEQDKTKQGKLSGNLSRTCQMIDITFLNVRKGNERWPELELELEDA